MKKNRATHTAATIMPQNKHPADSLSNSNATGNIVSALGISDSRLPYYTKSE